MQGQILDYSVQSGTGTVSGADGNRYHLTAEQWNGEGAPARGMSVDFEAEGDEARNVYIALSSAGAGSKDKIAAGLLALFLGALGIHKFYLGRTGPGLVYLLTNTVGFAVTWMLFFIPNIVLGAMALIEGIIYLTRSDEEFQQLYVVGRKAWF